MSEHTDPPPGWEWSMWKGKPEPGRVRLKGTMNTRTLAEAWTDYNSTPCPYESVVPRAELERDAEREHRIAVAHVKKCETLEARVAELEAQRDEADGARILNAAALKIAKAEVERLGTMLELEVNDQTFLDIIRRLHDGMREWAADEDGVHYRAADAFNEAAILLGRKPLKEG